MLLSLSFLLSFSYETLVLTSDRDHRYTATIVPGPPRLELLPPHKLTLEKNPVVVLLLLSQSLSPKCTIQISAVFPTFLGKRGWRSFGAERCVGHRAFFSLLVLFSKWPHDSAQQRASRVGGSRSRTASRRCMLFRTLIHGILVDNDDGDDASTQESEAHVVGERTLQDPTKL